jgi:hypothetical protein
VVNLPQIELPQVLQAPQSGRLPTASAAERKEASQQKGKEAAPKPPTPPLKTPSGEQLQKLIGSQAETQSALAEATTITLPIVDLEVPVPRAEIVSTAAITSTISVGAAMSASVVYKWLVNAMKPVFKAAASRVFGRHRHKEPKKGNLGET